MNTKEMLDNFLRRDNNAIEDLRESGYGHTLEARLAFVEGRLTDAAAIAAFLLRKEVEREKAMTEGSGG